MKNWLMWGTYSVGLAGFMWSPSVPLPLGLALGLVAAGVMLTVIFWRN